MTEQAWTKEPWPATSDGDDGACEFFEGDDECILISEPNYDRARACVNPMAGIDDPAAFVERAKALMAEVDRQAAIADRVQARLPEILGTQPKDPNK